MSENALTRRTFLTGTAGVAAACACTAGIGAFAQSAQAQPEADAEQEAPYSAHSLCNACSSKCGFTAYVKDGKLDKVIGDERHPNAKGKLCARGYGYTQIAYSPDRLTSPLRKNEQGGFDEISWDEAYREIAKKVQGIISSDGPAALAMVQDPRPSGKYYTKRFMNALGSANVYTHAAACNLSKESGFTQVIGKSNYSSDLKNTKMVMFIGRSYADAIRPSSVAAVQKAHDSGAYVVLVDPRCNNTRTFADQWVPINPGTDLALILAMSHVLVTRGLYDRDFVSQNSVGFDQWADYLQECTPEWAEAITGIRAVDIESLALRFAQAAPAASIEPSWRGAFGCAYANSGETARAICLFNTLLGCWNQKGGALITSSFGPGKLDPDKFPKTPDIAEKIVGSDEFPLALSSMGSNLAAAKAAEEGRIKGMFFYNSNMAAGYSNPEYLAKALSNLELMVVVDVQMSETALLADYVLPECTYLERMELPEFIEGSVPSVSLRDQVLPRTPNTKSVDEIFSELGEACGVGSYFQFSVEELADAQLQTVGLSLDALRQAGTVNFPEKSLVIGELPEWKTPTGKIQFTSEACQQAGLSPYPVWIEPAVMPSLKAHEMRLVGGKQAVHSHTQTANCEPLMQVTQDYDLTRVWINAGVAAELGIADGDDVEISNQYHSGIARAKVTQRINPTALFMPSHYGVASPDQHVANGVGLRIMDFVPFDIEPAYGSAMTQETVVKVKKAGA